MTETFIFFYSVCQWPITYLLLGQFTGAFVDVNVSLAQAKVGVSSTNTLDGGQGEWDLTLTIDVGVLNTKNVLELFWCNQCRLPFKEFSKKN